MTEPNSICREHSGLCREVHDLRGDVADHEARLRGGQDQFAAVKSDLRVVKILITLAVIASFMGGAVGPKIWKAFGFIH